MFLIELCIQKILLNYYNKKPVTRSTCSLDRLT